MGRAKLTTRQRQAFDFLKDHAEVRGYMPSVWEISRHLGYKSKESAADLLTALAAKGYIHRDRYRHRGISLVGYEWRLVKA